MLHVCRYPRRPEEGVRLLRARVIGSYEAPNLDAGN